MLKANEATLTLLSVVVCNIALPMSSLMLFLCRKHLLLQHSAYGVIT